MNRFDRIIAILIQLQSRTVVRAQDIAEKYNISLRTVYRDIRSLEEAGLPLIGEAGKGYTIMDGYRLPPITFTREEAITFITSQQLMSRFTDAGTSEHHETAITKIKAVLRYMDKSALEEIESKMVVLPNRYLPNQSEVPMTRVLKCIMEKRVARIHYFTNHSMEENWREIEPIGTFLVSEYWHLVAYCRLRKDYRNFRMDRIRELNITGESFEPQHPPLNAFLNRFRVERELKEVIIKVPKVHFRHVGDQKYYHGFVEEYIEDDWVFMRFLTSSMEGIARWMLMGIDIYEVVEPAELVDRIDAILQHYFNRKTLQKQRSKG